MTTEEKLALKRAVKEQCLAIMQERLRHVHDAIEETEDSVNNENKSTVGDKHEVARAMGHLQQEMMSGQLDKANDEIALISALNTDLLYDKVTTGAVVVCPDAIFFIAVGLGNILVNEQKVIVLSPIAPLALSMLEKQRGDTFEFNRNMIAITDIF